MPGISEWLLLFLVNAAWQAAFVAVLAVATDRLLRGARARYRHLLWVAALILSLIVPAATALRTATPQPRPLPIQVASAAPVAAAGAPLPMESSAPPAATRFSLPPLPFSSRTAIAICGVYALLLLLRIGTLGSAWLRTRRVVRDATEIVLPRSIAQIFERCRNALGTGKVRVLSSSVPAPVTAGALRPVVILPGHLLREGDPEVVTSAVAHELAHIARHDYLFNLAYELLALPLWFHPALALVLRRIRETREVRCDEIVAERLQDAHVYAQSLVELAGAALPLGRAAATITVGIADADILEERVKTLLNRPRLEKQALLLIAAALLFVAPCIAAARIAVRVHVQPLAAAAVQQAEQAPSTDARQEFINQHQPGDMVRGKVVKTTEKRAVIALAPGVNAVIRIPQSSSAPYVVGSEHDFQLLRTDPEQKGFSLFDPSSAVAGGPAGGVEGGVRSGVVGGVAGGKEGPFTFHVGNDTMNISPKIAFAYDSQEQSSDPMFRKKLEAAESKRAIEERAQFEREQSQLTPEERAKRLELEKQMIAAARKQLLETAREAKISIAQAISIAQTRQPGTVVESRLARERGVATYIVSIVSGDESNATTTRFLINAVDGTVMDTFPKSNQ